MNFLCFATIIFGLICAVELRDSAATVNSKLESRIIGGDDVTDLAEIPFQVSVQYKGSHHCAGSFLSQNWVLTAAICTYESSLYELSIRAGSLQHAQGGIVLKIEEIIQHPKFNSTTDDYDFSLLRLMSWYSDQIVFEPARLPHQGEDIPDDSWLRVSGWGENSTNLQAVYVSKLNQAKCNLCYAKYGGVTDRMFCAGPIDGGKGPCYGDSGAPLSWNGKLFGIASWVEKCGKPRYPGVYSLVSSVREWINGVANL